MARGPKLDNREFVITWMNSNSLDEVASALGVKKTTAQQKATYLRKLGVRLPKFRKTGVDRSLEVAQLNSLIKKHSKK